MYLKCYILLIFRLIVEVMLKSLAFEILWMRQRVLLCY